MTLEAKNFLDSAMKISDCQERIAALADCHRGMFCQDDKEGMEYIDKLIRASIEEHNAKIAQAKKDEDFIFNPNSQPVWA